MRFSALLLALALCCAALVPASAAQPSGKPIVIGLSIAMTGEISDAATLLRQGYELWVKDQNAKGGLLGRPVELKIYDDQSDPQTSAKLYEKLITEDKVDLVIGPYSSGVTSAASTVAEKYHMAMLAAGASAAGIWKRGYKYVFQVPPSSEHYYYGAIDIAKKAGYKTVAILGEDNDYPRLAVPGTAAYAQKNGMQVVYQDFYPPKTTEFSSYIQHLADSKPDVFVNAGFTPEDVALLHAIKGQGLDIKEMALGVGASLPDWEKNVGKDGEYVFAATQWESGVNTPGNKQFVSEFQAAYNRPPDYRAAQAYGAGQILAMAVTKDRSLDQDKLRDTLSALKTTTVFNRYQVDSTGAQVGASLFIIQWLKGEKQVVWPFDVATAKYVLPTPPWNKR